jgi:hypothetical protein
MAALNNDRKPTSPEPTIDLTLLCKWREVSEPPDKMGMYIVDLGHKRVCAAYWVPIVGFTLDHSEYIGLEDRIIGWMQLPEGR